MIWYRIMTAVMFIIYAIGVAWINLNYIQPYGMFGEGGNYCEALREQGYFEGKYDTAEHKNCTIGLREGVEECDWIQKKILNEEDEKSCFNYDSYDDECEDNIDMKDFGTRCVWGGFGYFATVLTAGLWALIVGLILMGILVLLEMVMKDEGDKDEA